MIRRFNRYELKYVIHVFQKQALRFLPHLRRPPGVIASRERSNHLRLQNLRTPFLAPEPVTRQVSGHGVDPGGELPGRVEHRELHVGPGESILADLQRILPVSEETGKPDCPKWSRSYNHSRFRRIRVVRPGQHNHHHAGRH